MPARVAPKAAKKSRAPSKPGPSAKSAKPGSSNSKPRSRTPSGTGRPGRSTPAGPRADKGEGAAAVRTYLGSLPSWQRDLAKRIDGFVAREVPDARRAVKWGAAFYGVGGQGWFVSVKGFSKHLKVTFFRGTSLRPVPPSGEDAEGRSLDVRESDPLDERTMVSWIRQAAQIPGWGTS